MQFGVGISSHYNKAKSLTVMEDRMQEGNASMWSNSNSEIVFVLLGHLRSRWITTWDPLQRSEGQGGGLLAV